ncbi:hypothetical protein LCGC14_0336610 [marine sediment metagenome]|uniref:DUF2399 domain-containing protein n=1 Tax=marine sediment metagenome TaxID=412755 RepID=A0A0F9W2C8_9ZZZZ
MPYICYHDKTFSPAHEVIIAQANQIIDEYLAQGYRLTLRQLYYQFVSRDWLPNEQRAYKRLGGIVSDARNAGRIDWAAIEDRTRDLRSLPHWDSLAEILGSCASQFRFDAWADQPNRIEVWIEKDALLGVFEPVCQDLDVPLFSCRGYTSQSEVWAAGQRLAEHIANGQRPVVLHFGDHDPSGMDMTRDIADRLSLYADSVVEIRRLALNRDQIDEYEPPPNPAKMTDSRFAAYVDLHGDESWELDALEPSVLAELVDSAVRSHLDPDLWEAAQLRREAARDHLRKIAANTEEPGS